MPPPPERTLSALNHRRPRRTLTPLDDAIEHLVTDPALTAEAADRIASVVRDLYHALARQAPPQSPAPLALHLRAASVMKPGVPERLASLLKEMRVALEAPSTTITKRSSRSIKDGVAANTAPP